MNRRSKDFQRLKFCLRLARIISYLFSRFLFLQKIDAEQSKTLYIILEFDNLESFNSYGFLDG